MRKTWILTAALLTLAFAPAAEAAVPNVFGDVPCSVQANDGNVRLCDGQAETFDGTGIDVNVILPPEAQGDGPFPAIGIFHGWGGSKLGVSDRTRSWAERGYAVFSMSDRGWGNSCGAPDLPDRLNPAVCGKGYNHLMDTRYEVRDAQFFFAALADEGRVIPNKIGVTGGSYGGGLSMALAALKNRVMMPDGKLVPWTSDGGKAMQIAVAAPEIPWTDLAYSLLPHGRTLDYVADNQYFGPAGDYPIGVPKQSYIALLYGLGQAISNYAPPGTDPSADLVTWFGLINGGDPIDQTALATDIAKEVTTYHSSYYIPTTDEYGAPASPAPLLISNGWTDDLFPVDEAVRFYNRTRAQFGTDFPISLYGLDYGHARGQNKSEDIAKLDALQETWFDHYLKGVGPVPEHNVTAITQTCPGDAPSAGPFTAPDWDSLSPGEVRFTDESEKTITPGGGNPADGATYDPAGGNAVPVGGACATTTGPDRPGTATYSLPEAKDGGYTLLGSPTVIADITTDSPSSQIAGRLLDVAPSGERALVARGLYRTDAEGRQVFQLHPGAWKFENGHVPTLELLPADQPYGRNSNLQSPVTVANLDLRLPVRDDVGTPQPSVLPAGTQPAPGVTAAGPCESGLSQKGTKRNDRLKGTAGGDRLRGGKGNDKVSGKDGDDCLSGGRGKDRVAGGNGDDTVKVRDKERDRVNCGKGKDKVTADRKDKLRGCEKKKRK